MTGASAWGPIGIFDSGVGGLTVARAIRELLPEEEILYFGDTGYVPYGPRPLDQVREFGLQICDFLVSEGAKAIVMGCNMSSAVTLAAAQRRHAVPMWGTIEPGARGAIRASRSGRIGVVATVGTIASGAYEQAVRSLKPEATVRSVACPALVPLIEAGDLNGDALAVVRGQLAPLSGAGIDTLILGCTHYPLLAKEFSAVLGPQVRLIDPAQALAEEVAAGLRTRGLQRPPGERVGHRLYASGPAELLTREARRVLGENMAGPVHRDVHAARAAQGRGKRR